MTGEREVTRGATPADVRSGGGGQRGGDPTFRALTHAECDALLARNHVGRIAWSWKDRIDIQPIHYVYEAGWLFGRTSEGSKVATLAHHNWVAFEVDEVAGPFDWKSVVVHGTFHRIDLEGSPRDQAAGAHAVHLLQQIVPDTLGAGDPVAFRTVVFRVAIGEVTGREARAAPVLGDVVEREKAKSGAREPGKAAERRDHSGW